MGVHNTTRHDTTLVKGAENVRHTIYHYHISPSKNTRGNRQTKYDGISSSAPNLPYIVYFEDNEVKGGTKRERERMEGQKRRVQLRYTILFLGFQQYRIPSYFSPIHLFTFVQCSLSPSTPHLSLSLKTPPLPQNFSLSSLPYTFSSDDMGEGHRQRGEHQWSHSREHSYYINNRINL